MRQPKNRALWESEKYISWPYSQANPVIRVPRAQATPESKTIRCGDDEEECMRRCIEYRNKRGLELWGPTRWAQLLAVSNRMSAKPREIPNSGVNGVFRNKHKPTWVASWYEPVPGNPDQRRKRSKHFGFGEKGPYASEEAAFQAACAKRREVEKRWYSAVGRGENRVINRID